MVGSAAGAISMSVVVISTGLWDAYQKHQRFCKRKKFAVTTLGNYQLAIPRFIKSAEDNGFPDLEGLTKEHLDEYFDWFTARTRWDGQRGKGNLQLVSDSTWDTEFRRIRAFFNWCVKETTVPISESPLNGIETVKLPETVIDVPTQEMLDEIYKLTDYKNKLVAPTPLARFRRLRDRAAIFFLIESPTRLNEINSLRVDDIVIESHRNGVPDVSTKLWGKGDKERTVAFGRETSKTLVDYIEQRSDYVRRGEDALWVSAHSVKGRRMSNRWLWAMLHKLGLDIRTDALPNGYPNLHPHMFRHLFAFNWLRDGKPEYLLKAYAGWSDKIPVTYTRQINSEQAADLVREESPVDTLVGRDRRR